MPRRELGQHRRQAPHMVLVGVTADDVFQPGHPGALEVGHHQAAVRHVAAVVQHALAVTGHQDAEGLAHVDEVYSEAAALRRGRGLGGPGTGASLVHQGGQVLAARQAENQGCRQGQGRQAACQPPHHGVMFHFLPLREPGPPPSFLAVFLGAVRGANRAPGTGLRPAACWLRPAPLEWTV